MTSNPSPSVAMDPGKASVVNKLVTSLLLYYKRATKTVIYEVIKVL